MSAEFTWTCRQCGRSVPRRVEQCRCGERRQPAAEPARVLPSSQLPPTTPMPAGDPPSAPANTVSRPANVVVIAASLVGVSVIAAAAILGLTWIQQPNALAGAVPAAPPSELVSRPAATDAPEPPDVLEPPSLHDLMASSLTPADGNSSSLPPIEEVVRQTLPAVVKVETPDGVGSGFFVSADTLLTNAHVVGSKKAVNLLMSDGQRRTAAVADVWYDADLAVLKIDIFDPGQVFLAIARPEDVKIGAEVIAIGSPLGLQNTVTRGIISGLREYVYDRIGRRSVNVVQTDAAINPGNSGGPLLDRYGRVVGVNTLKMGGRAEGLGFAVDMYYARRLLGPDFALKSAADQTRENALRRYEDLVRGLAQRADEHEARWKKLRHMCFSGSREQPVVREWFVLRDQPGAWRNTPACEGWKPVFFDWAALIHEALREYHQGAVEAGVPPEKLLQIRRRYNMVWPAWEKEESS